MLRNEGMRLRCLVSVLALPLGACATAGPAPLRVQVDLEPARKAVEEARQAGAPERAQEPFAKAEGHLKEAEGLNAAGGEKAREADWLGRLAVVEAQLAAAMAHLSGTDARVGERAAAQETDRLATRLRKANDEQRRLEEKVASLAQALELTEKEVIRTKARLKGNETKAEASSAIAEARILLRRMSDEKGRSAAALARGNEDLTKAEGQLKDENFGAAVFFAMRAQESALKAQETARPSDTTETERVAPKKTYMVKTATANIRRGPATSEPIVAKAPKGATLEASAVRGDWIRVSYQGKTGWVSRTVVE